MTLFSNALTQVWITFSHNWLYLLFSIVIASLLKLYLNSDTLSAWLRRYRQAGIIGATAAAVATPLCSCGTTAILLGMLAGSMPWAPIVAFMVASPLTSPQELIYSAGLFGWKFAWAFFLSSIFLGLLGGVIASVVEARGWLKNQSRIPAQGVLTLNVLSAKPQITARRIVDEMLATGKTLLGLFFAFAFVGYILNGLIPAEWLPALFGDGRAYGIPLAATLGLPFYINTEASLPLVRAMLDGGMSEGAALAFLITGAGTSFGAIAGAFAIARWRVISLVVGTLWLGAVIAGWVYSLLG